jgi:hypothetical protein
MRALTLDYRRRPRSGWAGVALLVAGVAGTALLGEQYRLMLDQQALIESGLRTVAVAARKNVRVASAAGDAQRMALEVRRARKLLLQMSMPWNEMFASVEAANSRNVALLSIESDIDKQRVKISAEAKNLGAMLNYVRDMEGRPAFADVYLQSHQVQLQDAQRPVRFVLGATWRSPG